MQINLSGNISCLFLQLSVVGLNKTTVIPVVDEDEEPDYDLTDEFKTSKLAESSTTEKVIVPVSVCIRSALYVMNILNEVLSSSSLDDNGTADVYDTIDYNPPDNNRIH